MKKLLPLLGFVCLTVHAEEWRVLSDDSSGQLSVDVSSIKPMGSMREVWAMRNFKEPKPTEDAAFPNVNSYKDMYVLNCEAKTMRLSREIIYAELNGKGDLRDQSHALINAPYAKPEPGTIIEQLVNDVCAFNTAKPKQQADGKTDAKNK